MHTFHKDMLQFEMLPNLSMQTFHTLQLSMEAEVTPPGFGPWCPLGNYGAWGSFYPICERPSVEWT